MVSCNYTATLASFIKSYLPRLFILFTLLLSPLCLLTRAEAATTKPVMTTSAAPASQSNWDKFLNQQGLFGNWSQSPALDRYGITPSANLTSDIQGNPVGGTQQGLRQFSNIYAGVTVDLQKLVGAPGTIFFASFSERFGLSLTKLNIGNAFNVAQVCCGATWRVVDVYLEQPIHQNLLNIRAGRLSVGDEFLSSPLYWYFVQNGIDGNPVGIFKNSPGMSAYPRGTWGLRVRFTPINQVDLKLGVYNGDPTLGQNSKHGLDWSNRGPGFYIAELGFHPNINSDTGLPGNYKVGLYYDNSIYTNFLYDSAGTIASFSGLPLETRRGSTGYYFLFDQMIFRKGSKNTPQGLTPFISYLVSPNKAYTQMPYFINGGLVYQGPFDSRALDVAGIAAVYGSFSATQREAQRISAPTSPTQNFELVFESFYRFQATPWLKVQPDVQYIINPNGTGSIPNAIVLGGQVTVVF